MSTNNNDEKVKYERYRTTEINALGRYHKIDQSTIDNAIESGMEVIDFGKLCIERQGPVKQVSAMSWGLRSNTQQYSLTRAIRAQVDNDWSKAGYEREVSQEISHKTNRNPRGIFIPENVLFTRDLQVGTITSPGSGGGNLASQIVMGDMTIDVLRNDSLCLQAGVKTLSGLSGDTILPKITKGSTTYWSNESKRSQKMTPHLHKSNLPRIHLAVW